MRSLARLVVCVILASSTTLGDDPCANMTVGAVKNGTAIPKIPMNAFSTDIRVIILNKNMTIDAKEYADEAMKAGALVMYFNGSRTTLILDYKNNQVYTFGSQAGTSDKNNDLCTATNMTADIDTQLFGGSNSSSGASMPHMFSTSRILQLANNSVMIGRQTLDSGIPADHWSACMHWSQMNSTFRVDYYFTVANYTSPSGPQPVPAQAEVQGITTHPNGTVTKFHHIYQYVNFRPYIDDPENMLNTPPGVFCLQRSSPVKVPNLKNSFYYQEEIIDPNLSDTSELSIWYNYDMQLLRYDSRQAPITTSTTLSGLGPTPSSMTSVQGCNMPLIRAIKSAA
ncbi:uncharacterized protein LOC112574419 [Pomacea canaliculata]|uniref:uncharacterized protein LOC112574419 n=1 Tax=Pomacea canaliculata TaxID=400727 RepID=UPI000D72F956|nr:uncharacterized protein LOC112574419 [Pomacea canaliculata]